MSIGVSRAQSNRDVTLWKETCIICNHPPRFGSHMYCGSGDKMFLIYHLMCSKVCVT